eukprot:757070-Prorocentrum_minimum.AAC.1
MITGDACLTACHVAAQVRFAPASARSNVVAPSPVQYITVQYSTVQHITSFYGSSCANNGEGALNTPVIQYSTSDGQRKTPLCLDPESLMQTEGMA